ncbi:MAG: 5-(carboxyamino)imidazole ribonucleotide mutase [Clostridia bacterium]|nr:5-(carboxyamino)imidazole ribonucleotide mutase [Clostridia bacterium]
MKKVAVIMGSTSDLPVASKTVDTLKSLGVPCEARVMSAHRTPDAVAEFAAKAREEGYGVLIAEAGMAAHLAGAVAARTTLPVIGVPLKSAALDGVDALLSTVQMPPGIPVACVGVDAAVNAALLAAQILAVTEPQLASSLEELRRASAEKVLAGDAGIRDVEAR